MTIKKAKSIGEVQRKLEAAMEHMNSCWGQLATAGLLPEPLDNPEHYVPHYARRYPLGGYGAGWAYALSAMSQYLAACHYGMLEFVGSTDGQLCPYDDCCHDLAIEVAGWCKCGHCGRAFYADDSDGDFEDYHCRRPGSNDAVPEALLLCRDLGPSWATPKN